MLESPAQQRRRGIGVPLLVVALFVLPIALAWWLAESGVASSSSNLLNHGTLVTPPLDIHASDDSRSLAQIPLAPSEWAMVYFAPGTCESTCEAHLGLLKTIRSVLGHDGTRVRIALLLDSAAAVNGATTVIADTKARELIGGTLAKRTAKATERGFILLDWRGQIAMYFPETAAPADIKADLKRLLRASAIR